MAAGMTMRMAAPGRRPDALKMRLLALGGGSALVLACALVVFLLQVRRHGILDWTAALEMSLLSAGLTGTVALAGHALRLRTLFLRQRTLKDDLRRR